MTTYAITKQIPPLAAPGTRSSQINRVFNAALGVFLGQGERYDQLYARYMGIAPRFRPTGGDCDPWVESAAMDDSLKGMLSRGVLRFGYVAGAPYVYMSEGSRTGFDYELGEALTRLIGEHYLGDGSRLRAEWVEVTLTGGDDQSDKLKQLYQGLVDGTFDIALSGQMMLPESYLAGLPIEWTAPTALLFTTISYTGRDDEKLDLKKMGALAGGDQPAFEAYAVAESKRLVLELRIFSVNNPGPSPTSATRLVYNLRHAGAKAVWDTGDVSDTDAAMYESVDHFAVGDSLAQGYQASQPGFHGTYLNVPANDELWPIAGFTAGVTAPETPEMAVFAEH